MSELKLARLAALCGMTAFTVWGGASRAQDARHETSYRGQHGLIIVPASSQSRPGDAGIRAHTNISILFPGFIRAPNSTPPAGFETPASLACVYGFVAPVAGCNPSTVTALATGGSKLVIVVDAFDDPTATNDLTVFSKQYGLPAITPNNFQVVYQNKGRPKQDGTGGWELEESLDIEMAHALAPAAKVILVEAYSQNNSDLFASVTVAAGLAAAAGGGEVSSSWGQPEFSGEEADESVFTGTNVVFVAATGDTPGTIFPSELQNVIGAGGTSINRSNGNFVSQTTWEYGGGGASLYVPVPPYQSGIKKIKQWGPNRAVPDISFDANPDTGVVIYDTTPYDGVVLNWAVVGGTSIASPSLAAMINSAGSFAASTSAELTSFYKRYIKSYASPAKWTDIELGLCGNNGGAKATKAWDFCTGIGVPNGYAGK
jgi:subtilase family serine protease